MSMLNKLLLGILTVVLSLSFNGCGSGQSADPVNIAFLVGIADDETMLNVNLAEFEKLPNLPGSDYSFVSVSGKPEVIGETGTIPDLSDRGYTKTMMKRIAEGIKADLTSKITDFKPDTPELDMAAAIETAVRSLNANKDSGKENMLVIYASGKSTAGLINMLDTPVYKMDIEPTVKDVAKNMVLDMSDIDVIWYCCGDTGSKQDDFSANEKNRLKTFYSQLFTTLGAKSVTFKDNLPSSESYCFNDTPVSTIEVESYGSHMHELVELTEETVEEVKAEETMTPFVLTEEKVRFLPDSAEFLDANAAAEAIQPMAKCLKQYEDKAIVIYGTCAGDSNSEYVQALGKARSEKVKQVLVDAGIDAERIITVSVKAEDDPYYQFGLGTGIEAGVNRKTVLVDMSSELAQKILSTVS